MKPGKSVKEITGLGQYPSLQCVSTVNPLNPIRLGKWVNSPVSKILIVIKPGVSHIISYARGRYFVSISVQRLR